MVFENRKHKVVHHSNGNGTNGNGNGVGRDGHPKNMRRVMPPNHSKRHNHSRMKIIPSKKEERTVMVTRILREDRMQ
jgi:hypothetical protein